MPTIGWFRRAAPVLPEAAAVPEGGTPPGVNETLAGLFRAGQELLAMTSTTSAERRLSRRCLATVRRTVPRVSATSRSAAGGTPPPGRTAAVRRVQSTGTHPCAGPSVRHFGDGPADGLGAGARVGGCVAGVVRGFGGVFVGG